MGLSGGTVPPDLHGMIADQYGGAMAEGTQTRTDASDGMSAHQMIELLRTLASNATANQPPQLGVALEAGLAGLSLVVDTMANLNRAAQRLNTLLDDLEGPLRQAVPHVAAAVSTLDRLGDVAASLNDLSKRLGPLTAFLPKSPTSRPESPQAD
jgi:ABC-type transporter Mla subunit MlaD